MYNFEPTYEKDTHNAVQFSLKDEDDQPIDISGSTITMRLSKEGYAESVKALTIVNTQATLPNSINMTSVTASISPLWFGLL